MPTLQKIEDCPYNNKFYVSNVILYQLATVGTDFG